MWSEHSHLCWVRRIGFVSLRSFQLWKLLSTTKLSPEMEKLSHRNYHSGDNETTASRTSRPCYMQRLSLILMLQLMSCGRTITIIGTSYGTRSSRNFSDHHRLIVCGLNDTKGRWSWGWVEVVGNLMTDLRMFPKRTRSRQKVESD